MLSNYEQTIVKYLLGTTYSTSRRDTVITRAEKFQYPLFLKSIEKLIVLKMFQKSQSQLCGLKCFLDA